MRDTDYLDKSCLVGRVGGETYMDTGTTDKCNT